MMQDPIQVKPRRAEGTSDHVEIYLPEQVMVIFHADVPALVAHISSGKQNPDGTPYEYSRGHHDRHRHQRRSARRADHEADHAAWRRRRPACSRPAAR